MRKMYGVTTAIVTPFTADDEVDLKKLEQLVEFLIAQGVHGLYPNGSTGEMNKMSLEERKRVAEAVTEQAKGRTGVFIQVGAQTTAQTLELARHAHKIGADGIGVLTPQYMGVTDEEMVRYFVEVAQSVPDDFPVYLYNIPQCSGNDITPAVVEQVLERTQNVVGIKYSFSDMERFRQYLQCGGGAFDVICGQDRLMLPALVMGCKGVVSGCSQCDPAPFLACYRAFMAGDIRAAQEAARQLNELCDVIRAGSNIAYTKAALEAVGLAGIHARRPAQDLTPEERQRVLKQLSDYRGRYGCA